MESFSLRTRSKVELSILMTEGRQYDFFSNKLKTDKLRDIVNIDNINVNEIIHSNINILKLLQFLAPFVVTPPYVYFKNRG